MKLLIGYLILINAAGFFSMFLDKQRARKGRYRISERWLLSIAAAGGSAGSLAGMYLFRHKTRHRRFFIGLPVLLFLQIVLLMVAASSFHAEAGRPSAKVRQTLDLIQEMDDETIQSFVTYKALTDRQISEEEEKAALDAVRLFFERFHYEITDEQITGDTARVTVNITNLDAHSLAHDLCLQLTSQWINIADPSEEPPAFDGYYRMLCDTITDGQYALVQTPAVFELSLEKHQWILQMDQETRDQLMGGLSAWLNNPYILTPEEILSLYMEAFRSLDTQGWIRYLGVNDLFATGSSIYGPQCDALFFEKLTEVFDWKLDSCSTAKDQADARITITSIDMARVLEDYHQRLLTYAGTTDSITSDSAQLSDTTAELLMEALRENAQPDQYTAAVLFYNDGVTWQPEDLSPLVNAMLGNLDEALEVMR